MCGLFTVFPRILNLCQSSRARFLPSLSKPIGRGAAPIFCNHIRFGYAALTTRGAGGEGEEC